MRTSKRKTARGAMWAAAAVALSSVQAQAPLAPPATQERKPMRMHASGSFDVQMTPQGTNQQAEGSTLGRLSVAKQFHGELEASSEGQMLTAVSSVQGSAGYVAIERVTGSLNGRRGSFVLQHSGTMSARGVEQHVTIVPDSGTGQLVGLAGSMTIQLVDATHGYQLEYTLPDGA